MIENTRPRLIFEISSWLEEGQDGRLYAVAILEQTNIIARQEVRKKQDGALGFHFSELLAMQKVEQEALRRMNKP